MITKQRIFTVILMCLLLTACSSNDVAPQPAARQQEPQAAATLTNLQPEVSETKYVIVTPTASHQLRPPAEDTIYAFLTAYDPDPNGMLPFLSPDLLENMPTGGVYELLNIQDSIEGFAFQSGSNSPDPDLAYVQVAIQVSGEQHIRLFTLVWDDDSWLVDQVKIVE